MSTVTTYYGILFSRQVSIFSLALEQACCIMSPRYFVHNTPTTTPCPGSKWHLSELYNFACVD